jgi:cell division protein ZipA
MSELRLILLIVGVLFVVGVAGYEWWRSRGSRPTATPPRDESHSEREPIRSAPSALPEINVVREARISVDDDLPVIELRRSGMTQPASGAGGIALSSEVAVDAALETPSSMTSTTSTQAILRAHDAPYRGQDDSVSEVRVYDELPPSRGPHLVLAWPKEDERRIVTLRVIPQTEPRFQGRTLRQAFAAAGFWHGPLDIYHLPEPGLPESNCRVVVSAAALAHPGTFDPSIMDSQRFSGINLFAVLPGPLPEREAFDELVHAARQLAERLDGRVTDQHGEELTAQRISRLRQSLAEAPQARAAGDA